MPPADNLPGFLNTGPDDQAKRGMLLIGGSGTPSANLDVEGNAYVDALTVDNDFKVMSDTLHVNSTSHNVGIGTASPVTKLDIEGAGTLGGLEIDSTSISCSPPCHALSVWSSTDYGVQGLGITGGVKGVNDNANGIGVQGQDNSTAGGYGVYGASATGSGVYGKSDTGYAIYAETTLTNGWAGYFTGRVFSNNDVIGTRFLATNLQASLVPFTQGQVMNTKTDFSPVYIVDIAYDSDHGYLWGVNGNWDNPIIYKIRPADGLKTGYTLYDGNNYCHEPSKIIYANGYLWVTCYGSARVFKINPSNYTMTSYTTTNVDCSIHIGTCSGNGASCDGDWDCPQNQTCNITSPTVDESKYYKGCNPSAITYDGTSIWTTSYTEPNDTTSLPGTSSISKINATTGALSGPYLLQDQNGVTAINPVSITFDGTNIWTANCGTKCFDWWAPGDGNPIPQPAEPSDSVSKIDTSDGHTIGVYSVCSGSSSCGSSWWAPSAIVSVGGYIWTGNFGGNWAGDDPFIPEITKIDPSNGQVVGTYPDPSKPTAWIAPPNRLLVDNITTGGPYIWVGSSESSEFTRFNINTGQPLTDSNNRTIYSDDVLYGLTTSQTLTDGANQYTYIWTADAYKGSISKIKSLDNKKQNFYLLQGAYTISGLTTDGSYIWTANPHNNSVSKIRAADGQKIADYQVSTIDPDDNVKAPRLILYDGQNIWVLLYYGWGSTQINKIKASDGSWQLSQPQDLSDTGNPVGMILDNSSGQPYLWILLSGEGLGEQSKLVKYDVLNNNKVAEYGLNLNLPPPNNPQKPQAMAFDGQNLWIASYYNDSCVDNPTSPPNKFCNDDHAKSCSTDNDCTQSSSILKVQLNPFSTGTPITITGTYRPIDIIYDGKYLWTANYGSGSNGSVSKWLINGNALNEIKSQPVNTGERPHYLAFDGTYIWVANDNNTNMTILRASDNTLVKEFSSLTPSRMIFDGSNVWMGGGDAQQVVKFYASHGYGQQTVEQAVRLQNIVPGNSDAGNFNISGDGTVTADTSVGGNVSAPNNLWGGSSNSEVPISGQGSYNCPDGYFVMDIQLDSITGKPTKLLCRPL